MEDTSQVEPSSTPAQMPTITAIPAATLSQPTPMDTESPNDQDVTTGEIVTQVPKPDESPEGVSGNRMTVIYIGGGVLLLIVVAVLFFILGRKSQEGE